MGRVVLDEPRGPRDPILKMDVKYFILHARDGMDETFIPASHDMKFVRDVCAGVALVSGGRIIRMGPAADVLTDVWNND